MDRPFFREEIHQAFEIHPVVALLGPRQTGKTTAARQYMVREVEVKRENFLDLENPEDLIRLENPALTLSHLAGLVVIDEIQRKPDLFPVLRVLVDQDPDRRFLILGSASRELLKQSSESLAGRIQYLELTPFSLGEILQDQQTELSEENILPTLSEKLWLRGGFPRSYLAASHAQSSTWRKAYIRTFLEQDIPNLGIRIAPLNLRRFWMLMANYHGQMCNLSEVARHLQLSQKTVSHYLDILTGTFMLRQLPPWFENIEKRQVKRNKIYFRDSGIYHALLNLNTMEELSMSQKIGSSWEGFVLEELIRVHNALPEECFFWSTQSQAELDLLIVQGEKKYAFEVKRTEHPKMTKSLTNVLEDLKLDKVTYIYPGKMSFWLHEKVFVTNLQSYVAATTPRLSNFP